MMRVTLARRVLLALLGGQPVTRFFVEDHLDSAGGDIVDTECVRNALYRLRDGALVVTAGAEPSPTSPPRVRWQITDAGRDLLWRDYLRLCASAQAGTASAADLDWLAEVQGGLRQVKTEWLRGAA